MEPKSSRQRLAGFRSHLPDAQGENQPAEILGLTGLNGRQQLFGRYLSIFPEALQLLQGQVVDVRRGGNIALFNEPLHNGAAQPLNVHGVPGDKMGNVPGELRRTFRTGAPQEGTVLIPDHRRAANRANFRQPVRLRTRRTLVKFHLQDFRNDLPRLADFHRVANANVLFRDEILVVQGGIGHGGARQPDRANHCLRRQYPGAAHLD